jgi:hypothetical protein
MKSTLITAIGAAGAALGLAATLSVASPASAAVPVRGTFNPIDPVRVLDTRDGTGVAGQRQGPLGAGQVTELVVTGTAGVPAGGVGAVVVNLTATQAPGPGYVTAYPCGEPRPYASNINFTRGVDTPNQVTVKVGDGGKVCFFASTQTHLLADLSGWYADDFAAVPGLGYRELDPARILDTRDGTGAGSHGAAPLVANQVFTLPVAGRGGVPSTGVRAVTMNVTAADAAASGYLTVFPCDRPRPNVSNVNFDPSMPAVANLVTVRTDAAGQVCIVASQEVDVMADVQGYFVEGPGLAFTPLAPARVLDTRDGTGVDASRRGPFGRGEVRRLHIGGVAGVPADARAVLLNVTVTDADGPGFVTVFPCDRPRPWASSLNHVRMTDRANLVKVRIDGDGDVCFYSAASTQLVADLQGYYTAVPA